MTVSEVAEFNFFVLCASGAVRRARSLMPRASNKTISQAVSQAVNEAVALQPSQSHELIALVALFLRNRQQQHRMADHEYYELHKDSLASAIDIAMKEATAAREQWHESAAVLDLVADSLCRSANHMR